MSLLCAVALVSVAAFGGGCPELIDWSATRAFAPGMRCHHLTLDEPRLMENYMVRVDLHTPGLRVTGILISLKHILQCLVGGNNV